MSSSHPYRTSGLALVPAPENPDRPLPHDFGDAQKEARAATESAALFDAGDRGRVRVEGSDSIDLLGRVLAGDLLGQAPGTVAENLLLTPKGRVRFSFSVERAKESACLVTAPLDAQPLLQALDQFVFSEDIRFEDQSDQSACFELLGPSVPGVLERALGLAPPTEVGSWVNQTWKEHNLRISRPRILGTDGWRLDAGPGHAAELWQALLDAGATPAGLAAREALRIDRCVALVGLELPRNSDDAPYPQEARLEHAFSLTKGCFVGQEVVAKLDTYGGLNQILERFFCRGKDPIKPGTPVLTEDGQVAGHVTSWSEGLLSDSPALLALLKTKFESIRPLRAGREGPLLESPD